MAKITGVHHAGINVADMDLSVKFYEALGGKVVHSFEPGPGMKILMVDLGGAVLELVPAMGPPGGAPAAAGPAMPGPGLAHFAVTVDDTRAVYDKAIAAGAKPGMFTPTEMDLGGKKAILAYIVAPNGETLELYQEI